MNQKESQLNKLRQKELQLTDLYMGQRKSRPEHTNAGQLMHCGQGKPHGISGAIVKPLGEERVSGGSVSRIIEMHWGQNTRPNVGTYAASQKQWVQDQDKVQPVKGHARSGAGYTASVWMTLAGKISSWEQGETIWKTTGCTMRETVADVIHLV